MCLHQPARGLLTQRPRAKGALASPAVLFLTAASLRLRAALRTRLATTLTDFLARHALRLRARCSLRMWCGLAAAAKLARLT